MLQLSVANVKSVLARFRDVHVDYITLHWTAGRHGTTFPDYQINITGDGLVWLDERLGSFWPAHTWHRNSRNLGIGVDAMLGATSADIEDPRALHGYLNSLEAYLRTISQQTEEPPWPASYGHEPPTRAQLQALVWLIPPLMRRWGLGFDRVRTHTDWASIDGYGPGSGDPQTRWDWWAEGPLLKKAFEAEYRRTKPPAKK